MFSPLVFWIDLDESADLLSRSRDCLSARETEEAESFATPQLRQRALGSRVFLRSALSCMTRNSPKDHRITISSYGKPEVSNDLFFNLSHSEACATVAVHPTRPVGIDVEKVGRTVDVPAILSVLSSSERRDLDSRRLRNGDHLRLWTRKEATSKALGYGLHIDFSSLDVGYLGHKDGSWKTIATHVDDMPKVQLVDLELPTGDPVALALVTSQKPSNRPSIVQLSNLEQTLSALS